MKESPYVLSPDGDTTGWTVIAHNQRVYKAWNALMEKVPESLDRCLEYLCECPMQRYPKRVFPLKGKKYKGAWEFEVTKGDRVYYVPNPETRIVTVYYAGEHPKPPSPTPPKT
jgi:hypothetical protein